MKTRSSKVLSVMLCVLMLVMTTGVAFAEPAALTGSGSADAPYLVQTADDLAELAGNLAAYNGKNIKLAADIGTTAEPIISADYAPIGTAETPFTGTFDGGGHKLTFDGDFTIDEEMNCFGVFGSVSSGAVIKDFTVYGFNFTCGDCVGVAVGSAVDSQISGITVQASGLGGVNNVGGIVGLLNGGSVADCKNEASVEANAESGTGGCVGGIVGRVENNGSVLRCINTGAISANDYGESCKNCGGIVGYCDGTVSRCLNNRTVASSDTDNSASAAVGGIAGYINGAISYCGNAGAVSSALDAAGVFGAAGTATVSYCYNAGDVTADKKDTIGFTTGDSVSGSVTLTKCLDNSVDLKKESSYAEWEDFDAVWFAPSGSNNHGYPYPMLRDCSLHTWGEPTEKSPATCTEPQKLEVKCTVAGCEFSYEKDGGTKLGHQMEWVVTKPATCGEEGSKIQKCTRTGCGYKDESSVTVIPATGEHQDPDGDGICNVCEKEIPKEEEQPAKRNFFQKIGDFFRKIFEWIRNLFKRNK